MAELRSLVALQRRLFGYGYDSVDQDDLDGSHLWIIKTQRRGTVRYVCAVSEIPQSVGDCDGALRFYHRLRRNLTKRYAKFPWWKELGTFAVLSCDNSLFTSLRGAEGRFKHKTGLHMNVMLGTVLVNRETLEVLSTSTWGLFHSGRHFGAICAAVSEWTENSLAVP